MFFAWVLNREVAAACMPTISNGTAPAAATDTTAIATMISTSVKPPSEPARRRSISSKRDTGCQSLERDGVGLAGSAHRETAGGRGTAGVEEGAFAGGRASRVRWEGHRGQRDGGVLDPEGPGGLVGRDRAVRAVDGPRGRGEVDAVGPALGQRLLTGVPQRASDV